MTAPITSREALHPTQMSNQELAGALDDYRRWTVLEETTQDLLNAASQRLRAVAATPPRDELPGIIGVLRNVHSALDRALGDSDVTHIESDDELMDEYPVQWATQWLFHAIELLEEGPTVTRPLQAPE